LEPIAYHDTTPESLPLLHRGLRALSEDLGDPFRLTPEGLDAALFGPSPACHGLLALGPGDALMGVALYSPVMSSVMGRAGVYVSDLWVAEAARGRIEAQLAADPGALRPARTRRRLPPASRTDSSGGSVRYRP